MRKARETDREQKRLMGTETENHGNREKQRKRRREEIMYVVGL